jgi:hypothetical protein
MQTARSNALLAASSVSQARAQAPPRERFIKAMRNGKVSPQIAPAPVKRPRAGTWAFACERSAMTVPIEDHALIGDCKTAALVSRDGSIDWLCWPRFDSASCFTALLGTADNGRWLIAPKHPPLAVSRHYRAGTLVLETEFQTETGRAAIIDFMPPADGAELVRIVTGRSGCVEFHTEFVARFNYGATVPWVNRLEDGTINAIAGPERLVLRSPVRTSRRRS